MSEKLTDAEIICTWMEPKPNSRQAALRGRSDRKWWVFRWTSRTQPAAEPSALTLDALWEVEERLTDDQVGLYDAMLRAAIRKDPIEPWVAAKCHTWHADAPTRIKALAAILRPIVEGGAL